MNTKIASAGSGSGPRFIECQFSTSLVRPRKCKGEDHEVCSRSRALESSLILFKQNQFHPQRKTKVTRRKPRVRDWGRSGRPMGEARKTRKPNPKTIARRLIKATEKLQAELIAQVDPKSESGKRTAQELGIKQGLATGMNHPGKK